MLEIKNKQTKKHTATEVRSACDAYTKGENISGFEDISAEVTKFEK